jgi:hypothetical protein
MPATQKIGSILPQSQRTEHDFDPQRGYITRQHFEGISRTEMLALQQQYVANGIACRLIYPNTGDIAQLEVEDSTQAIPIDDWGLDPNDENLSVLLGCPASTAALEAVFGVNTADFRNACAAIAQGISEDASPEQAFLVPPLNTLAANGTYGPRMKRIYTLYQSGTTEFKNDGDGSGYVLRHTTNAPNRWTANIADFGVGCIYTTAQLLSEAQNGTLWNYPLPARLAYKILNLRQPASRSNYQVGWFKCRSREGAVANNRVQITQNYIFGQWSTDLYDPY